jgi:2,4-dienoyl-CoA reductase-like NADH-dependent reductase (Old Yellow Enzyme family)
VKAQLTGQTNLRTDAYGGSAEKRAKFVLDILSETRKVLPATFCIGIKFNSADHSSASFEDTMAQIGLLVDAGIDFLEVSGGSYEDLKVRPTPVPNPTTRNNPDKKTDDEH